MGTESILQTYNCINLAAGFFGGKSNRARFGRRELWIYHCTIYLQVYGDNVDFVGLPIWEPKWHRVHATFKCLQLSSLIDFGEQQGRIQDPESPPPDPPLNKGIQHGTQT